MKKRLLTAGEQDWAEMLLEEIVGVANDGLPEVYGGSAESWAYDHFPNFPWDEESNLEAYELLWESPEFEQANQKLFEKYGDQFTGGFGFFHPRNHDEWLQMRKAIEEM